METKKYYTWKCDDTCLTEYCQDHAYLLEQTKQEGK